MNGRVGAQLCHHSYSAGMMIFCAAPGCALDCDRRYLKSMQQFRAIWIRHARQE
jgi:hypothetical protein